MKKNNKKGQSVVGTGQYIGGNAAQRWFSQPCPDEMCVTLRYSDTIDTTASVGLIGAYRYAQNDVYDPDISGVGNQPVCFDEWNALFTRWCVVESSCDVSVTSRATSNRFSVALVPVPASGSYPASYDAASEMRYAKSVTTTGGGPTYHLRSKISTAQLFGVPPYAIEADDNFSGTNASGPTRQAAWIVVGETSGSSDAVSITVVLKYRVRFWVPRVIATSLVRPLLAASTSTGATVTSRSVSESRREAEDGPAVARVLAVLERCEKFISSPH